MSQYVFSYTCDMRVCQRIMVIAITFNESAVLINPQQRLLKLFLFVDSFFLRFFYEISEQVSHPSD